MAHQWRNAVRGKRFDLMFISVNEPDEPDERLPLSDWGCSSWSGEVQRWFNGQHDAGWLKIVNGVPSHFVAGDGTIGTLQLIEAPREEAQGRLAEAEGGAKGGGARKKAKQGAASSAPAE